jgi:hypothetical protein
MDKKVLPVNMRPGNAARQMQHGSADSTSIRRSGLEAGTSGPATQNSVNGNLFALTRGTQGDVENDALGR